MWLEKLYYWTVLAKGMRDGGQGYPRNDTFRFMESNKEDVDALVKLIDALRPTGTGKSVAEGKKSPLSSPGDDYDEAVTSLRNMLKNRGASVDSLDREAIVRYIDILSDVRTLLRQGAKSEAPGNVDRDRLSYYEAELVDVVDEETSKLREKWESRKHALEATAKKIQHHLTDLLEEYKKVHARHEKKEFKQPLRMLPSYLYVPVMVALGLAEFAFNLSAFKILRMDVEETYMIAAGPAIVFPFIAHFIGTKVRQGFKQGDEKWRTSVVMVIALVCALIAIIAIGMLRTDWLAYINKSAPDHVQTFLFMAMNLLFLGGATLAAYFAHDPDRELERICKHKAKLRKGLDKEWNKWIRTAGKYDTLRGTTLMGIERFRDDACAKIDEYRYGVTRTRTGVDSLPFFQGSVTNRLFKPINMSAELDRTPATLDAAINKIEAGGIEPVTTTVT